MALVPVYVGLATGDVLGQAVMGVLLRIVLSHHSTFLINSAAHVFGSQPYSDANSARDNAFLAPVTFGEGYHNFHHMWPWDYRNAPHWYQWDPGKWLISACAWIGLARGLRRVPGTEVRRARVAMEAKRLTAQLALAHPVPAAGLREVLAEAKARVDEALAAFHAQREAWDTLKAQRKSRSREKEAIRREARARCKADRARSRQQLRAAWAGWKAARSSFARLSRP